MYEVRWRDAGWSYAEPVVRERRLLFGVVPWRKEVWRGGSIYRFKLRTMLPDQCRRLYQEAVDEYERVTEAWSKEIEQ